MMYERKGARGGREGVWEGVREGVWEYNMGEREYGARCLKKAEQKMHTEFYCIRIGAFDSRVVTSPPSQY